MARFAAPGDGPLDPGASPQRQFVDGYGEGIFRVGGAVYEGSIVVLPDRVLAWAVTGMDEATEASLAHFFELAADIDILLFGTGARTQPVPAELCRACAPAGVAVEPMDTGAAARTYNVLLAEDRHVAAALIVI